MAIRPVSSVNFLANRSNAAFEGRRKNQTEPDFEYTPIRQKLAVPLAATIIAMSPMSSTAVNHDNFDELNGINEIEYVSTPELSGTNQSLKDRLKISEDDQSLEDRLNLSGTPEVEEAQQNAGRVVASKSFFSKALGESDCMISLINTKGGSGFDKIGVSSLGRNDYVPILALQRMRVRIIGDDGIPSKHVIDYPHGVFYKDITAYGRKPFYRLTQETYNYIKDALNSPDNHSDVKEEILTTDVGFRAHNLENKPNGDIWKKANPYHPAANEQKVFSQKVKGDNAEYTVSFYSNDGDSNNAEFVTVKKDGYPELRVQHLGRTQVLFNYGMSTQRCFILGDVGLVDGKADPDDILLKNDDIYNIVDDKLTTILINALKAYPKEFGKLGKLVPPIDISNRYSQLDTGRVLSEDNI